jgi:hypothetical protein
MNRADFAAPSTPKIRSPPPFRAAGWSSVASNRILIDLSDENGLRTRSQARVYKPVTVRRCHIGRFNLALAFVMRRAD